MTIFRKWLHAIFAFSLCFVTFSSSFGLLAAQVQLISTESDPDAFIQNSVNVINGDYCESATDLEVAGPDALVLQRFYSTKDSITGTQTGGWRILPQRFLVIGKDSPRKSVIVGTVQFDSTLALVGERSGGILPYSGWRNTNGQTKDPLKIDVLNNTLGMVNTYAVEINGQTNHQNNLLNCKGSTCEMFWVMELNVFIKKYRNCQHFCWAKN
jgi:collagen type I alpha